MPVEHQVGQHSVRRITIGQPLSGFREFEHAFGDDPFWHRCDAHRQLPGGRDAQRLAQHAIRRREHRRRKIRREVRHRQRVGRERHAAFINAHAQTEPALHAVVAGGEVREGNRPGALRAHAPGRRGRLAGSDVAKQHRFLALQHAAAQARTTEGDTNLIGVRRARVQNGDARLIRLARAHGARMREGQRELRVAHQH